MQVNSQSKPAKRHIVLVTSSQPAANPRLCKEAEALAGAGYRVSVLYCHMVDWGNGALFEHPNIQWIRIGGHPQEQRWQWMLTRLRRKIYQLLTLKIPFFAVRAACRTYSELLVACNQMRADLYIGHTICALPVVALISRKQHTPFAFDAEDFHREESIQAKSGEIATFLENRYLSDATYISCASPLIASEYHKIFPNRKTDCILNVFRKRQQPTFRHTNPCGPLRLFWFSQTIGPDRGLEAVIEALNRLPQYEFEMTILGASRDQTITRLYQLKKQEHHRIAILPNIPEDELINLASTFDIGLALEQKFPFNRDICLSNKIFTYLLAGNAVIATETSAQKQFIEQYPGVGRGYPVGDVQALAAHLEYYYLNRQALNDARRAAWRLANEKLNWEEEQKRLLRLVESVWM